MKTSVLSLCLLASAALFFSACAKDESAPGESTGNYSPLTTGSTWTYKYTEGSETPENYTLTATNRDSVANGRTYKVLTSSDGSANRYLAKIGSDYYRFASFPDLGINSFEELYLKDNKAVNETWTATAAINYGGFNINADLTYTIKGKAETRTVNGKAFDNVTHVRLDISVAGSPSGGGDFYYQEGVGLIENNISVTSPLGQSFMSKEELISYEIK